MWAGSAARSRGRRTVRIIRSTKRYPCRSSSNCSGVSFSPARSTKTAKRSGEISSGMRLGSLTLVAQPRRAELGRVGFSVDQAVEFARVLAGDLVHDISRQPGELL